MGEEVPEWQMMWGAKVKTPVDVPDDMLKDAILTSQRLIGEATDFEAEGVDVAEKIKREFDERWTPYWHVIIGKNFGSFVTHETKRFLYFYFDDKAVMIYKAG
uniref:Dynein light chain n=1 Tax=Rhizochromulina marina TaxID=1034831 RepID=A0A7S2W886_9STRA|mmetsp:Transcript_17339/g.50605  ORF Transcript_17339/g.50605 Transcript_17339/m.50605 type:complete len:103 (+) Transcript_17339:135-443(+)